jgi:hypothetical protein
VEIYEKSPDNNLVIPHDDNLGFNSESQFKIIGQVALLIRYSTIRMAERCWVCGRWLAKTGLSVGGVCLGAFGKYRELSSEALAIRSLFDFGTKIGWHAHCDWLQLLRMSHGSTQRKTRMLPEKLSMTSWRSTKGLSPTKGLSLCDKI